MKLSQRLIPVASAVDAGDNKVLVVGGYELGAMMIKVEKQADGSYRTTELLKTREFGDQTIVTLALTLLSLSTFLSRADELDRKGSPSGSP